MGSLTRVAMFVRNVIADSIANLTYRFPTIEPAIRTVGLSIDFLPQIRTVYRRGVERYTERLVADGKQHRRINIGDISFLFDISDFTSAPWYFYRRYFEPQTTQYLLDALTLGQTVFDVGANRGYITMIAAMKVGETGRVHCFEPNPTVRVDLEKHLRMNQVNDRLVLCSDALSDSAGHNVKFYVSNVETNTGLSSLTPSDDLLACGALSSEKTIMVRTNTLDEYVRSNGITSPIDLIKVDVEGAELLVLMGAERTIREQPPRCWIVETEPDSAACKFLTSRGYRIRHLDPAGNKVNALFTLLTDER